MARRYAHFSQRHRYMTEPTTDLGGANAIGAFVAAASVPPSELQEEMTQKLLALSGAATSCQMRTIVKHLNACADALDDVFNQMIRDALLAPKISRVQFETALQAQALFREIFEYLREHDQKNSRKRNDKNRRKLR